MQKKDEKWALFWCRLLNPVIFEEKQGADIHTYLREVCQQEVLFPNGVTKKPSLTTLRRKLKLYQQDGFKAFARKVRSDRGKPRAVSEAIIEKAVDIKKDQPRRSENAINQILESHTGKTLTRSTLFRHLKQHGATRMKLGIISKKVRKRWTAEATHDIWVGDFMEGVCVRTDTGDVAPTQLCLWIDAHSRFVIEGRYYYRQTLDVLIDSLLRAWSAHGKPKALYIDNAKVYHSKALASACYSLTIDIIHSKPHDPSSRGVVERIFKTIQDQFEPEVRAGHILSLKDLNEAFSAWLRLSYQSRIHSETGQTPQNKYNNGLSVIRYVNTSDAIEYFMKQETRIVNRTYSDISLNNQFFRVDPKLRGDRILVRFDPYSEMKTVMIYDQHEVYLGEGVLYHRERGAEVPVKPTASSLKYDYLALLKNQHHELLRKQSKGIDYRHATDCKRWSFPAFIQKLAELMGKKGGLSAFHTEEIETLKKQYDQMETLSEPILINAWGAIKEKTIPFLMLELNRISRLARKEI